MEELSRLGADMNMTINPPTAIGGDVVSLQAVKPKPATETPLEPLPPGGPYRPTVREIQTALKNADYYKGSVDGKAGPLTKKAIEEFQKANNLVADGKVGPKTWAALNKYLSLSAPTAQGIATE